jgi:hypothetical protein
MGPRNCKSPKLENFGTFTWESWDKMPFACGPVERHKVYYKGEGGGFPQVWTVVNLVSPSLPVACPSTKSAPTMH